MLLLAFIMILGLSFVSILFLQTVLEREVLLREETIAEANALSLERGDGLLTNNLVSLGETARMSLVEEPHAILSNRALLSVSRWIESRNMHLVVQVNRAEALASASLLTYMLIAVGVGLLLLTLVIAFVLSRELTHPLRQLAQKISGLKPGSWGTSRTIHTGDEVELLDVRLGEMGNRLQRLYEHLEEEVGARTKELKQQYAFDRAVLEGIQHGVVTVDLNGRVSGANSAALSLLGMREEDLLTQRIEDAVPIYRLGINDPINPHPVRRCLKERKVFRPSPGTFHNIKCKDGTLLPTMFLVSPLLQGRRCFGTVLVFQDVRDERHMEELKSEFITLASHQLRTPLSILRWHMDLLKEEDHLNATQTASVEEMRLATDRMTNLLNALLQVAQLEGDGIKPKLHPVDMLAFIRTAAQEVETVAKRAEIKFLLLAPKQKISAMTDTVLLSIALQNLLTNAVKYSQKGGQVTLGLKRTRRAIEITVEDSGLGVPAKDQRHLFEKFFRAANVKKVDTDGSGLGLYISKMIIESLGGAISMNSNEGKGSIFTILLPLNPKEE